MFWLLIALCVAGGCRRDEIKVYSVPKESTSSLASGEIPPERPDASNAATGAPQLRWKTPEAWKEGAPSEFRVASFTAKGPDGKVADVSVIPLPGGAGSDFSNVNRWRSQVNLEPVTEVDLSKLAEAVEVAGLPAKLYDLSGDSQHILAVIQRRGETAWFFKMTGDTDWVTQQKPAFVAFLKSIRFLTDEAPAAPAAATAGAPQWKVPPAWKEAPAGQFLFAKYTIGDGGGGQAAVNISTSPGDGGGLAANVDRWRKQLGLGEVTGDELAKSVTIAGPVSFVEMNGAKAALVGAIVSQPGQTWFYKLMGDTNVVAAQKDAFVKFVEGVKY
jgi:hypothetical protein